MKKIIYGLLILFTISCQTKDVVPVPTVAFTARIEQDGSVDFNSSTANSDSYLWDFGDGGRSTESNPTHVFEKNGIYVVTLTATGKGGQTVKQNSITINNITGSVLFWMQATKNKQIEIYVDGNYYGLITGYYSSGVAPGCSAQYCVTVTGLTEGNHVFTAKESSGLGPSTWQGAVKITGRECTKMKLTY